MDGRTDGRTEGKPLVPSGVNTGRGLKRKENYIKIGICFNFKLHFLFFQYLNKILFA